MKNKMRKLKKGINDLATVNPKLASEWDYEENKGLSPCDVLPNSTQKVGWKVIGTHPITGKLIELKWKAKINSRNHGNGCPYLTGRAVLKGFNDLETVNPDLASQWDYELNANLKDTKRINISTPDKVSCGSKVEVNWIYPYDDPITGKHFDFRWRATIAERVKNKGCPFLSGQRVWKGFNDLETVNPELAKEWDYEANEGLKDGKGRDISTPDKVMPKSGQNVNWILPYDDPKTGKHFVFKWNANIKHRNNGAGCPFLSGTEVWQGFNDLKTLYPELAKEWDFDANKGLITASGKDISTPDKITASSLQKVNWIVTHKNSKTGEVSTFRWKATPADRIRGTGCPQLAESHGEKEIRKILKAQNLKFKGQNTFKDRYFISKQSPLKDDFAIFDTNGQVIGTIEYHGAQHYMPIDFAGKGKAWADENLKLTQKRDAIKALYLESHNIPQLIIPYTDFDKIDVLVLNFIQSLRKAHNI